MSRSSKIVGTLLPWGGLIGGILGAGLAHQIGSDSVFNDCRAAAPGTVLLVCLLGLLIIGAGAWGSWKVHGDKKEVGARKLIATVSLMTAALLVFAILLPIAAALIIPPCLS